MPALSCTYASTLARWHTDRRYPQLRLEDDRFARNVGSPPIYSTNSGASTLVLICVSHFKARSVP
jgi:hypothetical protein